MQLSGALEHCSQSFEQSEEDVSKENMRKNYSIPVHFPSKGYVLLGQVAIQLALLRYFPALHMMQVFKSVHISQSMLQPIIQYRGNYSFCRRIGGEGGR